MGVCCYADRNGSVHFAVKVAKRWEFTLQMRIHRTDNSKFEKIKILSYASESWTPGVFSDGDRNGKARFFVKVTERSRFDL